VNLVGIPSRSLALALVDSYVYTFVSAAVLMTLLFAQMLDDSSPRSIIKVRFSALLRD